MKMTIYKKLTTKEIAIMSMCSLRQADRIKKEIKQTFNIKVVRMRDYQAYYLM